MHRARIGFRLLAVLVLLSIPLASAIVWTHAWVSGRYVQLFGTNLVGETRLVYVYQDRELIVDYFTGWRGTPPDDGGLYGAHGLLIHRTVVTLTGDTRGDVILSVRVRWWLVLLGNLPPLLLAWLLARPLLQRRFARGRCPKCGYDLRATPNRCPECGEQAVAANAPPAAAAAAAARE